MEEGLFISLIKLSELILTLISYSKRINLRTLTQYLERRFRNILGGKEFSVGLKMLSQIPNKKAKQTTPGLKFQTLKTSFKEQHSGYFDSCQIKRKLRLTTDELLAQIIQLVRRRTRKLG